MWAVINLPVEDDCVEGNYASTWRSCIRAHVLMRVITNSSA